MARKSTARKQLGLSYRKLAGSKAPECHTFKTFEAGEKAPPCRAARGRCAYGTYKLAAETPLKEALHRYADEVSALKHERPQ